MDTDSRQPEEMSARIRSQFAHLRRDCLTAGMTAEEFDDHWVKWVSATDRGDRAEVARLNEEFHHAIQRLTRSEVVN